ncbi:MAG: hypothetical protein QW346_00955 [Candidatus Micrarchaeaceae archaeon]
MFERLDEHEVEAGWLYRKSPAKSEDAAPKRKATTISAMTM